MVEHQTVQIEHGSRRFTFPQVEARCHTSADGGLAQSFAVNVLMGRRDEPMYRVFARSLIESMSAQGEWSPKASILPCIP